MKYALTTLLSLFSILAFCQLTVTNTNDSGPGSLREAIANSSPGDYINFDSGLFSGRTPEIKLQSYIEIPHSLHIRPPWFVQDSIIISGENCTQGMFRANGVGQAMNVSFSRISFVNSSTEDTVSAALHMRNMEYFQLHSCTFYNCKSTGLNEVGGAVSCRNPVQNAKSISLGVGKYVNCSVTCHEDSLNPTFGGAVYVSDANHASIGGVFRNNKSRSRGGAIVFENIGNVSITPSLFSENSVQGSGSVEFSGGGALCIRSCGKTRIGRSRFIDNFTYIDTILPPGSGGVLPAQVFRGGAVIVQGDTNSNQPNELIVELCYFERNDVEDHGGAVECRDVDAHILNSTFFNNRARKSAAVRFASAPNSKAYQSKIELCTFYQNYCLDSLGTAVTFGGVNEDSITGILTNTTFYDNVNGDVSWGAETDLKIRGTVLSSPVILLNSGGVESKGFNSFSQAPAYATSTDLLNQASSDIDLGPLTTFLNEGIPCLPPLASSSLIDQGDSTDTRRTQSGDIYRIREIGSAEAAIVSYDTAILCGSSYTWNGQTFTTTGAHRLVSHMNGVTEYKLLYLFRDTVIVKQVGDIFKAHPILSSASYEWLDCDADSSLGVFSARFQPTYNGRFAVVMTSGNCSDTSACKEMYNVSLPEHVELLPDIFIYPNPASDFVKIEGVSDGTIVEIVDLQGRVVLCSEIVENHSLDIQDLKSGLYLLRLEGSPRVIKRLVVQR